jgi:trehalose utilization protein
MTLRLRALSFAVASVLMALPASTRDARPALHVLVWDEQQEAQKQVYPNYLGNHLADHLKKQEAIEVRSVSIKDPEQGLSDENVDWADVVVWWGHQKHKDVADRPVARIIDRVKAGKCGLVSLHSAHYSKPFKAAMDARFRQDVLRASPRRALPGRVRAPGSGAPG